MTWRELAAQCCDSIVHPERSPKELGPAIVLKSPKRGGLFPKGGGPKGKLLGSEWGPDRSTVYLLWYNANDVLAALVARGILQYTQTDKGIEFEVVAERRQAAAMEEV